MGALHPQKYTQCIPQDEPQKTRLIFNPSILIKRRVINMRFLFRTKGEHVQQKDKMKGIIDWGGGDCNEKQSAIKS